MPLVCTNGMRLFHHMSVRSQPCASVHCRIVDGTGWPRPMPTQTLAATQLDDERHNYGGPCSEGKNCHQILVKQSGRQLLGTDAIQNADGHQVVSCGCAALNAHHQHQCWISWEESCVVPESYLAPHWDMLNNAISTCFCDFIYIYENYKKVSTMTQVPKEQCSKQEESEVGPQ